jgi:hypothetical protein
MGLNPFVDAIGHPARRRPAASWAPADDATTLSPFSKRAAVPEGRTIGAARVTHADLSQVGDLVRSNDWNWKEPRTR